MTKQRSCQIFKKLMQIATVTSVLTAVQILTSPGISTSTYLFSATWIIIGWFIATTSYNNIILYVYIHASDPEISSENHSEPDPKFICFLFNELGIGLFHDGTDYILSFGFAIIILSLITATDQATARLIGQFIGLLCKILVLASGICGVYGHKQTKRHIENKVSEHYRNTNHF